MSHHSEMRAMLVLFFCLCLLSQPALSNVATQHRMGFSAPFNEVGPGGERKIPEWSTTNDTQVMQNFVRLTPNRQFKRGGLWSDGLVEADQFSAVFKFRISGPVCTPNMSQIMPHVNACPTRMADLRIAINAGAPRRRLFTSLGCASWLSLGANAVRRRPCTLVCARFIRSRIKSRVVLWVQRRLCRLWRDLRHVQESGIFANTQRCPLGAKRRDKVRHLVLHCFLLFLAYIFHALAQHKQYSFG